jgi:KDO2-lipid IV(A) lauroyltransferase
MKIPVSLLHPRHWPTWAGIGLLRLIVWLPYPAIMAVGAGLGQLIYPFALRRRQIAEINLRLCLPELDDTARRRLLRRHFSSLGKGLVEVGMAWWWPQKRLERLLITIEGETYLATGDTGVLFLTAHFSSLELSGRYLGARSAAHAMYRPNENPVLEFLIRHYRGTHLLGLIRRDDARGMIRLLKEGGRVWYAPDQNHAHKGKAFADFMGVAAATHTATSRLARTTGARVVPFVLLREPGGYRLIIEHPLEGLGKAPEEDARRINAVFARWARAAPEQYNWIHRRFKTRPDGGPPPYPARRPKRR